MAEMICFDIKFHLSLGGSEGSSDEHVVLGHSLDISRPQTPPLSDPRDPFPDVPILISFPTGQGGILQIYPGTQNRTSL